MYFYFLKVRRSLLREILHDIDSVGIRQRMHRRLHRRVYHVKAPNHLWHLDTNHKLIRWHFMICGGVDGFSRFIVYLKCENNNKADTLLKCFLDAVERHGTPLRIRTDQGMENFKIAEYMIRTRGTNRKSVIAGKSTHNQRIERLWRDVYEGVLCLYYDLFHFMEDNGILDPLNENHIYALHYVFCDKINEKLEIWKMAWARHRLRTARSSPLRLFTSESMNCPVELPPPHSLPETEELVNDDINLNIADIDDTRPSLNPLNSQISHECQEDLERNCPRNWVSDNHGIDIYLKAVEIIQRHI